MAGLAWGVAVVAAVCLLQLPMAHFIGRFFEQDESGAAAPGDLPAVMADYDRSPGVCPRCGTQNDHTFDYCAGCASPLRRLPEP